MKAGKNIFTRVTILSEGKDDHPNRKLGKGPGINRKCTRGNASTNNFTFQIIKEKQIKTMQHYSPLTDWQRITTVSQSVGA